MAFAFTRRPLASLSVWLFVGTVSCTTFTVTPPQTPRQERAQERTRDEAVSREMDAPVARETPAEATDDVSDTRVRPEGVESRLLHEMLALVNNVRREGQRCGQETYPPVQPLTWNDALGNAALDHAEDLAFHITRGHIGSDGSRLRDRVERYDDQFGRLGETIARGSNSPERALTNILRSDEHCRILMIAEHNRLGVALAENRHGYPYYVLVLGRAY